MPTPRSAGTVSPPPETGRTWQRRAWLASLALWSHATKAAPSGKVVLTLQGQLARPNQGQAFEFDMPMLEALPQTSFHARTPWFSQPRRFTGPLLRDVLAAAGARGQSLRLSALNDYQVTLPMSDANNHSVILARLLDDKPVAVRDKGPLLVAYPFDDNAELRSAVYYGRCVWQLRTIEVI